MNLFLVFFLDLSKAFDTVNHSILLEKNAYGFHDLTCRFLSNYLIESSLFVSSNSNIAGLLCGVPQGSIVGPLLFLKIIKPKMEIIKQAG